MAIAPTAEPAKLEWSDPKPREQGDASEDQVFVAVGRALTAWEFVEAHLWNIFSIFCRGSRGEGLFTASGRVYGAVQSGATRRQMLEEVADLYVTYENRQFDARAFKALLNHYQSATASRNNIAHGVVTRVDNQDGASLGYFLTPSPYLSKRNVRVDKWSENPHGGSLAHMPWWSYRYTAADIDEFTNRYRQLCALVGSMAGDEVRWSVETAMSQASRSGQGQLDSQGGS